MWRICRWNSHLDIASTVCRIYWTFSEPSQCGEDKEGGGSSIGKLRGGDGWKRSLLWCWLLKAPTLPMPVSSLQIWGLSENIHKYWRREEISVEPTLLSAQWVSYSFRICELPSHQIPPIMDFLSDVWEHIPPRSSCLKSRATVSASGECNQERLLEKCGIRKPRYLVTLMQASVSTEYLRRKRQRWGNCNVPTWEHRPCHQQEFVHKKRDEKI